MIRWRKAGIWVLCLSLTLTAFLTACGKQEQKQPTQTPPPSAAAAEYKGELPLSKEKVTVTGLIPSVGWVTKISDNKMNKLLEDRTNVHVEWIETSKEQFKDKASMMIAAGECPDMLFEGGILSKLDYERYGDQGIFFDLMNYISKYGYYIKKVMDENPAMKVYITSSDNKVYFLPQVDPVYHMSLRNKYWINQKWLDNLGLKMPATTDEFYEVLKAFKTKDPNKNGKADEIPMTGSVRNFEDTASTILCAFVPAGGDDNSGDTSLNNYEFILNDKITFTANTPEFRDGLRYLRKLYVEGLYDPAAFSQKREQVMPLVDSGDANRIGGMASHHPGNFASTADTKNGRFLEFAVMPPIKGPKGFSSIPWHYDQGFVSAFAISKKCKTPEILFKWADYFFSPEISVMSKIGFEGEHWVKPEAGKAAINGQTAKYKQLVGQEIHKMNAILGYSGAFKAGINEQFERGDGYNYEAVLYEATQKDEAAKVKRYPYSSISVPSADNIDFNESRKKIHGFVGEWVDRFILGNKDIEKDWDAYVKQLNDIGLDKYMKMLEKYYGKK